MKKIEITIVCADAESILHALNMLEIDEMIVSDVENMWGENMRSPIGDWCVPPDDHRKKIEIVADDDQVAQIVHTVQQNVPLRRRSDFVPRPTYGESIYISPIEQVIDMHAKEG